MQRQVFLPAINENPFLIFPEAVGWYKNEPMHCVQREKDQFQYFNLHMVLSGKGYIKTKNQIYNLQQGDAFLYFPSEVQSYYSDKENPWEILWVHFGGGVLLNEFLVERECHLSNVWTLKLWRKVKDAIVSLLEEVENNFLLNQPTLSTLTYGIIMEFMVQAEPLSVNKGMNIYNRIVEILPIMREMSVKPFQLKDWADRLDISNFYFCKMFKKTTGMSPSNFIMLCRLQKSKQLLVERQNWSVKRISLECGYPSVSYFGRLFRENEGVTPAEYRKLRQEGM